MHTRETDLAWAAGIVDGEGCISLHTVSTKKGVKCFVLRLTVANTSMTMLRRLRDIFHDGNIIVKRRASTRHREAWVWQLCSKRAESALQLLLPYLTNKLPEAKLGLESRALMQTHGTNGANPNAAKLEWMQARLAGLKRIS